MRFPNILKNESIVKAIFKGETYLKINNNDNKTNFFSGVIFKKIKKKSVLFQILTLICIIYFAGSICDPLFRSMNMASVVLQLYFS